MSECTVPKLFILIKKIFRYGPIGGNDKYAFLRDPVLKENYKRYSLKTNIRPL